MGDFSRSTMNEFILTVFSLFYIMLTIHGELRPISERQCVPMFVCIHGYCDISKFLACICDPGWKQPFCAESECSDDCTEGQECTLQNGNYRCVNQSSSTTTTQDTSVDVTETTTDDAIYCFNDSICHHGYCDFKEARCICEQSWAGDKCDLLCPFACFLPKICVHKNGKFACEVTNRTTESTTRIERSTNNSTVSPKIISQARNVCSDEYQTRPDDERFCLKAITFECEYGVCELTTTPGQKNMKCICDPGSYGGNCENICCRDCNEYGNCRLNGTGHEYCDCHYNYTGRYCEQKRPEKLTVTDDTSWTWWVIGGSIFIVLCLFILVGMVFYCMWRHRVLMIMKIVHKFQSFEDGDDKEFDAFVSYRSSDLDEHFVYKTLYPKLEKEMGFRLCLHYRDFIPGDTIANNIIRAINNSRRTIIVISPQYIQSDFTRFEYQVAQTEMLKRKHKIVPILLEDIQDYQNNMDENLKLIIESVTYIKWPGESRKKYLDHFWKQLQLSLPKKRKMSPDSKISLSSFHKLSDKGSIENGLGSYSDHIYTTETNPGKTTDYSYHSYSDVHDKQSKTSLEDDKDSGSFHSYCDVEGDINDINVIC